MNVPPAAPLPIEIGLTAAIVAVAGAPLTVVKPSVRANVLTPPAPDVAAVAAPVGPNSM